MKHLKNMTLKNISEKLNISIEQAKHVKGVITGKIKTSNFKSVNSWTAQCFNKPSLPEKRMCAINEILEDYGTEANFSYDYSVSQPVFEYVNVGDTYINTVIRDCVSGKYIISCWGDTVEYYEKKEYNFNP